MAPTSTKYFVAEGKSVGKFGPHTEIRVKDINSTDEKRGKDSLNVLIEKGYIYEADKPAEDEAANAKSKQNASLRADADLKSIVKTLGDEKVVLVSKLDSANINLGEAREEISTLTEKLATAEAGGDEALTGKLADAETALETEVTAHGETTGKLEVSEKALETEMEAHEKVSKELKEANAKLKASK